VLINIFFVQAFWKNKELGSIDVLGTMFKCSLSVTSAVGNERDYDECFRHYYQYTLYLQIQHIKSPGASPRFLALRVAVTGETSYGKKVGLIDAGQLQMLTTNNEGVNVTLGRVKNYQPEGVENPLLKVKVYFWPEYILV
jgi:hypothetical protein